ncbi:MAG: hypothetical protein INF78_18595 [Roseomonas sp.]|nr:hypothetical protein [Roseomonas sp.]MCA3397680.1 hypothetical protein [Roseomonas sp.]
MVALAHMESPRIKAWLGGIEPAWTLLDWNSFRALAGFSPVLPGEPIQFNTELSPDEFRGSAFVQHAIILLNAAMEGDGLKLTATGNLARSVVSELVERFDWPFYDTETLFRMNKVINEPDFFPLYMTRMIAQEAKLFRKSKNHLRTSPLGRAMLDPQKFGELQRVPFIIHMWRLVTPNYGPAQAFRWPLADIGIILWALSVAATDWEASENLARLCSVPIEEVIRSDSDMASFAMETQILRPLFHFGFLEQRRDPIAGSLRLKTHLCRRTSLFDRFFSFHVTLEKPIGSRH